MIFSQTKSKRRLTILNQNGFTMIDLILSIAVLALITTFISEFFINQTTSYMFVANRQEAIGDARHALNKIQYEMLRVDPTSEISSYDINEIYFTDSSSASNSFRLNTAGSGLGIYMGSDLLMAGVDDFTLTYYDSSGATLDPASDPASDIARIQIQITATEEHNEGNITLQTTVTPRSVIGYNNFQ